MTRCPRCNNRNLPNADFCDECGTRLQSAPDPLSAPPSTPSFLCDDIRPNPVRPLSPVSRLFEEPPGDSLQIPATLLVMVNGQAQREFALSKPEILIGRWDAARNIFPDIDLDQADLENKVSRRHARLFQQNGKYWIEDLGSLNGTTINRRLQLQKGHPYQLQHGDEIIVGKTFLKFRIA